MTIAKKKPGKNATKLTHPRAVWAELRGLSKESVEALTATAISSSQIQSRFWDLWSDHHRGNNSEIVLRQCHEARQRGEEVYDELEGCPKELWSYIQKATGEEFERVHSRVIALLSNRFIKNLNTKVPVMSSLQTWRCVLLGAVDRPFHVGLGIVPFDAQNAKLFLDESGEEARLVVRIVRGAEPMELRFRLGSKQKLANGEARFSQLAEVAAGKRAMNGGWLFRGKFGKWCVAWPESGRRTGRKKSRRWPSRVATVRGDADAALVITCGGEVRRLRGQLSMIRHVRRLATEQLAGRRYGMGGSGRIGHGRKRRRRAEMAWTDGKWQRLADRANDQLAFDVAAVTGQLGAGKVVYEGGSDDSALVRLGVSEATPRAYAGWQWHDLGTKIGGKIAIEGAEFVRRDGYFAGEKGGKSKPRKKKVKTPVELAGK